MSKAAIYAAMTAASQRRTAGSEQIRPSLELVTAKRRTHYETYDCTCGLFPWQCQLLGCGHFVLF